jgi:cell division protein FtsB
MHLQTLKKLSLFSVKRIIYAVIIIWLVMTIGFTGEQSFTHIYRNDQRLKELDVAIHQYEMEYERDTKTLHELDSNPLTIERIARERHGMKRPNELVFLYPEEPQQP